MHDIDPYHGWERFYSSQRDEKSPFYKKKYNLNSFSSDIYGYYIHPLWDFFGSETLYLKILYVNYNSSFAILELFGEWNDAINNDIMHLKRNIIDRLSLLKINKFILIGDNVLDFHGSDDSYYEEWYDDVEEGWIVAINFRYHIMDEWKKYGIASYFIYGDFIDVIEWRTLSPEKVFEYIDNKVSKLLL